MKLLSSLLALALLSACATTPELPEPTITEQPVPETLMTPPVPMKTIPTGDSKVDSNKNPS